MTLTRTAVRASAIGAGAGLLVAPFALTAPAANAAVDCGTTTPTATVINGTICEVRFDTAGSYSFTAPSGVSKLAAVVIGAGGGALGNSYEAYGAASGVAVYVDSVDTSANIDVIVGAHGIGGETPTDGEASSVNLDAALGGGAGFSGYGGGSNADFTGAAYWDSSVDGWSYGAGAGAGADGSVCVAGAGVTLDDIATDSTLFPGDDTQAYATGGSCSDTSVVTTAQIAGNGGSIGNDIVPADGVDGLVVLRWAATVTPDPAPSPLPSTGQPFPSGLAFVGASAVLAGGMAFAAGLIARRRRTN